MQCLNNLKQIALALHKYNEEYNCFPPAYTVDEQGKPMHSWRILILPFFDYEWSNTKYDFSQPWNSPKNIAFANESQAYDVFRCPTEYGSEPIKRDTSYVMLVGPNAFGNNTTCRKLDDIRDGSGKTIMLAEMSHSGILWTGPRDLNVEEMSYKLNDPEKIGMRSEHFGGLHIGLGDSSVRWISDSTDPELLKAMITINGGENMDELR